MANISSAYGTMEIRIKGENVAKTAELLYGFKDVFNANAKFVDYFTEIYKWELQPEGDTMYGLATFNGCGRWTYISNIERMFDWFNQFIESDKGVSEELKETWKKIKKHDWSITYSFADEECGLDVLYEAVVVGEYDSKTGEYTTNIQSETDYEMTPENLVKTGVCETIEGAYEYLGIEEY